MKIIKQVVTLPWSFGVNYFLNIFLIMRCLKRKKVNVIIYPVCDKSHVESLLQESDFVAALICKITLRQSLGFVIMMPLQNNTEAGK